MAITTVIMVLLFRVFASAANQWQVADQRIDAFRDARAALRLMTRDLGRACINGDPQMLTLANFDSTDTYAKEAYAITPIANAGKSQLCAVGYYLAWDALTKTFNLKRLYKNSDTAYPSLAQKPPDFTTLFTQSATTDESMSACIWDLRFTPGILSNLQPPDGDSKTWRWIEVRFKSMSAASARKLQGLTVDQTTWSDSSTARYRTLILPSEQQFVTRISLEQNR